ncbi:LacI family DNA-binding transcriptional regulator [Kineococcus sp. SYSU DK002]|uniref:LacI family DNA-binding transcriptional regulator n=1 Tax=Kineococcus sp. SYSU DK002 TaxID=3383123 RepID=UPI003D7E39B7
MGESGRSVTITEIAREAGVSVPTVSRVVNGRGDVAAATRERVEELLRRHDYRRPQRPRTVARAGLLDLVFDDLDSPWAVEIIRGVEDVAHAAGIGTVVSAVHRRTTSARRWLGNLRTRASDGVVLVASSLAPALARELLEATVPVVVVDPTGGPVEGAPSVGATNWAGGLSATEHLVRLGHRRVAHVSGPTGMLCSRARLGGYRAGLESAGLVVDPGLVREGDFYQESGLREGTALLALPDPPTAVFAASDQIALGVYEAVRRAGLRVPEDVSVVGFDDLTLAAWASPPLTTVHQPLVQMGALAARTVLAVGAGEEPANPRVELATTLVVRDSTAPPRAG